MDGQQLGLALLLWISTVSGEYLFTLPQVMEAGTTNSFCLLLNDIQLDGFMPEQGYTVNVRLKYMNKDSMGTETVEIQEATFGIVNQDGDFQKCQKVAAPMKDGRYSAVVNASMTYSPFGLDSEVTVDIFGAEKNIEARQPDLITLVQTDKPIYKPGQMVKFRVMTMDYMLMSKTDGYQQITIESPNGMRVMQWDDVPSPNGLVSLQMKLSSDPILGSWKIKVLYGSKEIVQAFKVDEYVLPKFEVTVTPPKYLLPTTKKISGTVCAKYTYGKSVKGTLKMRVCYKPDYVYSYNRLERPCAYIIEKINGCYEFFIDAEEIKLGHKGYSTWGSLKIDANVTEEQTGIELSGQSSGPRLTYYPLNLKIEDDSDNYFKPGFPYNGRVVVTNPDGSAAPGESIRVEGSSSYNSDYLWVNNFTSDVNGVVHFVITEFDSGMGNMNLQANAIVYEYDWRYTDDEIYIRTYTPSAYLRLTKWYSPSDSYIYMPDVDEAADCDTEVTLDVLYTAEAGEDYKFMTIVKAGDAVVYTEENRVNADDNIWNLDILSFDENQLLKREQRPTPAPRPTLPPLPTVVYDDMPEVPPELVPMEEVVEELIVPEVAQLLGEGETPRKKRDTSSTRTRRIIPKFLPTPINITVQSGQLATLKCHVENLGTKMVVWRKASEDTPLTIGQMTFTSATEISIYHTVISATQSEWNLLIQNVQPEHAGVYECQISSSTIQKHTITLSVRNDKEEQKPQLTITGTQYVNRFSDIHLECKSTGVDRAPEDVDWFHDGVLIRSLKPHWYGRTEILKHRPLSGRSLLSELIIHRSTMEDQGVYVCRSSDFSIDSVKVRILNDGSSDTQECVNTIQTDKNFSKCMIGFSTFMSALDLSDPIALTSALCSEEGTTAMQCILDMVESCPELMTDEGTSSIFSSFKAFEDLIRSCNRSPDKNSDSVGLFVQLTSNNSCFPSPQDNGGDSPGCAKTIQTDPDFTNCMMGYSMYMSSLNPSDSKALTSAMCSEEGEAAMQCILDRLDSCPELLTDESTSIMFSGFKTIEDLGGFDVVCNRSPGPDGKSNLVGHFQLKIPVSKEMTPSAKVLVFYIRKDKEVVATSLKFKIKNCFKNKVMMSFDETTVRPGANVNLNLGASPRSTCFVGMVDKSVNLLGGNNQLTPNQVFEHVKQVARPYHYISYWTEDRNYCEEKMEPRADDEYYYYGYYSPEGVDAVQAFRDVALWVETDAKLETRPCVEQRHYYSYMPMSRRLPGSPGRSGPPSRMESQRGDPVPVMLDNVPVETKSDPEPDQKAIRTFFPETWLWDIVSLGTGGGPRTPLRGEAAEGGPAPMPLARTVALDAKTQDVKNDSDGEEYDDVVEVVASAPLPSKDIKIKETSDSEPETIRSYFPETWLWDIVKLGDDGLLSFETKIPDTITEWIGNTVCTHESDGVGVTELTGVTAFKPFFLSLTLPYSAIRGEVLPVLATVFNYLSDCITLKVQFKETEGFVISDRTGNSREFCLCGGESESTKFHIIPTVIGEIDLEVTAVSTDNVELCQNVVLGQLDVGVEDGVQRQLLIEAEGMPLDQTKSSYTCVTDGEMEKETVDMILPPDLVPDSERATVSVVGDIMGPTLSNLKNLLRMPYGCGEQNMASWAPNIYVLQYLENTDQLTEELEKEAEGYMAVGYQRQMKYRHNDNSYSAWGDNQYFNATGSSWLTAFVVKSMAQSSAYIVIDNDDIFRSARWLVNTQQDDGCFPQVGRVFSSYLKGGLEGDNPAGLTAIILIALLEADLGEEFMQNISYGFSSCLDGFDLAATDTYTLTVMLYAYTIYDIDGDRRADVMVELNRRRVDKGGLVFWRRGEEETETESEFWWYRAPSAEVEMTAYVLLSMLAQGPDVIGDVQPIVQWLTKQRNPYGGFSSTQDTVVALQALAEFGKLTYSGSKSVTIEIKNTAIDHVFSVSPSNSLVFQSVEVNPSQGAVEITTSGSGCALIQVNMKYNVYTETDDGPAFNVKVRVFRSRTNSNNCAMRTIEVCTSYLKGGVSNMAIAEVKMPTGWKPIPSTLNALVQSNRIQKFEVDNNYVQLYFDEFSSERLCVDFDVEQEIEMKTMASLVRVYDYYETGYSVTTNYSIKTKCGTKEEIPLDNEGSDCSIMQCRVDTSKSLEMARSRLEKTCPTCLDTVDKTQLETMVCDADAVYKAVVRRHGKYTVKLMANLRPKAKVGLDQFANETIYQDCSCPILESGRDKKTLIFSTGKEEDFFIDKENIRFGEGQTLIPYNSTYEKTIRRISSRKKLCDKLSRLRRSRTEKSASRLQSLRRKLGVL